MEETNDKNKKSRIKTTFIITTLILSLLIITLSIINFSLKNSLKEEQQFKYNYKIACVDKVNTEIKSENLLTITSYSIFVENLSHNFTTYVIASESFNNSIYLLQNNLSYTNTYDHLIDYNTGKIRLDIMINAKDTAKQNVRYSKSFDCYVKGNDQTIKLYKTENSSQEYTFTIKPKDDSHSNIQVNIEILTRYKL